MGVQSRLGNPGLDPGRLQLGRPGTGEIRDLGLRRHPAPSLEPVLLSRSAVRQELKITDAQARERTPALRPEQQRRLDQIQLQAQGPLAFGPHNFPPAYEGGPLAERLKLSEDQVRRVGVIVQEGLDEIDKAASFPIPLDPKEKPGEEAIGKLVDSPQFQADKEKARRAARDAWAGVIRRIEDVLTDPQRRAYRELLGDPFDVTKLSLEEQGRQSDIAVVSRAFGVGGGGGGGGQGGGQRSDPNFDTKVARPAYADGTSHPRVLFDEAHHNFHTTSGRYKPFGQLIGNDGYQVIPNREKFSAEMLRKGDILVIANALGPRGWASPARRTPPSPMPSATPSASGSVPAARSCSSLTTPRWAPPPRAWPGGSRWT